MLWDTSGATETFPSKLNEMSSINLIFDVHVAYFSSQLMLMRQLLPLTLRRLTNCQHPAFRTKHISLYLRAASSMSSGPPKHEMVYLKGRVWEANTSVIENLTPGRSDIRCPRQWPVPQSSPHRTLLATGGNGNTSWRRYWR